MYCLCVKVYCTAATGCNPIAVNKYINISIWKGSAGKDRCRWHYFDDKFHIYWVVLRLTTVSLVFKYVYTPARQPALNNSPPTGRIFMKFCVLRIFMKSCDWEFSLNFVFENFNEILCLRIFMKSCDWEFSWNFVFENFIKFCVWEFTWNFVFWEFSWNFVFENFH